MDGDRDLLNKKETPEMAAICFASNDGQALPFESQPRPPRNLQDLLRYSTEAAEVIGETQPSSFKPLDEKSKKFLEEALKSMSVNVVEELSKRIKVFENVAQISEDVNPVKYDGALQDIIAYIDDIDAANDFYKIGGFIVLKPSLESAHCNLRASVSELIATLCQNNPYCQNKFLETGLLPQLLKMIRLDTDETVRKKALYAISSVVRGSDKGFQEFLKNDGLSTVLSAIQSYEYNLTVKASYLVYCLCSERPEIKDALVNMGFLEQLIIQLTFYVRHCKEGDLPLSEHILNAILKMVENNKIAQDYARRPELQFKELLNYVVSKSENMDQYFDEHEVSKTLLKMVFNELEKKQTDKESENK